MRILKGLLNLVNAGLRLGYLIVALAVILLVAYILGGHLYLVKGAWGTDTGSALATLAWIDKYFPKVPFWYPLVGGGISLTHSYPTLAFYLVPVLKRATSLDLIQSLRLLGWSSVVLMAVGIYTFVAVKFKHQTAALLAAVFYLISPLAWIWLFDWGFYAESISHIFVMPAIIFWDGWFFEFVKNRLTIKSKIYLVLTVVFLSLAFLCHYGTGFGLAGLFIFYVIGITIREKPRKRNLVRGLLALTLVAGLALLVTAFTWVPFNHYAKIAAAGGATRGGQNYEQVKLGELSPLKVLGLELYDLKDFLFAMRNYSFPAVVSAMAGLGIILSVANTSQLTMAIFALFAVLVSVNGDFIYAMIRTIPFPLSVPFGWRFTFIPLRMIIPALAALGVTGIMKLSLFWLKGGVGRWIRGGLATMAGLVIAAFGLYQWGNFPLPKEAAYRWGPRGINLMNIWLIKGDDIYLGEKVKGQASLENIYEQIAAYPWSEITIAGSPGNLSSLEQAFGQIASEKENARVDFSPLASALSMSAPYVNRDRNLSQIHAYIADSSLIKNLAGQQSTAFYINDPFYLHDPNLIGDWTRWYGIDYLFLSGEEDPEVPALLAQAGWQEEIPSPPGVKVLKYGEGNSLAEFSNRPTVLVITQKRLGAYDQIFRLAGHGVLPYEQAWLVWGREKVDDYSLEELKRFQMLLLDGYSYNNFVQADRLLGEYVKAGGRLFIDTGWQYQVPDWQTGENKPVLEVLPFKRLTWKTAGNKLDKEGFAPLAYAGSPWGVSTGEAKDLKPGAEVALTGGSYPLVVKMTLGEGKIVWSGMNLFAHAKQGDEAYWEEIDSLKEWFSWLLEGEPGQDFEMSYLRVDPDRVEFTINRDIPGGWLLWKEAYYLDFNARLVTKSQSGGRPLSVYRAGPGWSLIQVPAIRAGEGIVYSYRKPWEESLAQLISGITFLIIFPLLLIEQRWFRRSLVDRLLERAEESIYKIFSFLCLKKIYSLWGKDEEE